MNDEISPATIANRVMRGCLTAVLATRTAGGEPYASLVQVAALADGGPVLLLSTLAEHTKNLAHGAEVSLLFDGTVGLASPLTGPRVTLQGSLATTDAPEARARFLARHAEAEQYADFGDFAFYALTPTRAHLVAGFGAIHWIDWADVRTDLTGADEVLAGEAGVLEHMNEDHRDAMAAIAAAQGASAGTWLMTGCDPAGCDLRAGAYSLRVAFERPIRTLAEIRAELVRLTRAARAA